jgi:iron complex outermembrane receptor protein
LSILAALLSSTGVQAQEAANNSSKAEESNKLDAIIVTATKRKEPLQTVPVAITVVAGEQMEQQNLNTLGGITSQIPTASFRAGASNKDTSLFIRGVGTITTSPGVEPTVSTVIDGVVTARPGQATLDLMDIDHIEVLRGPQGTLFGKNASAGVINIVSKPPSKETERYIDLAHYQGNENRVRLGVSGELQPDGPRGSIALMHGEYDGNVNNVALGTKVNGYKRDGGRARLDFDASKNVSISLIADYSRNRDNTPTGVVSGTTLTAYPSGAVTQNPLYAAALLPVVASPTNRSINSEIETKVNDVNSGLSAQIDWNVGSHTITSITAFRKWTNDQNQDQDRLSTVYKQFVQQADVGNLSFNQTTQELRAASAKGGFFDYVVGLFYMRAKDDERYERDVTRCAGTTAAALPSGLIPCSPGSVTLDSGVANYGIVSKSTSLFGEGNVNFSKTFRGIAGLRWTQDDLSFYHSRASTQAAAISGVQPTSPLTTGNTTQNGVSGRVGPQFDLSKDAMIYATFSRGYKGPAYNVFFNMLPYTGTVPRDALALSPETSNSFEVGLKSTFFDDRLRFNLAAFDTKYKNYQANLQDLVVGTVVTRLINAGDVSTKGAELDFAAKLSKEFTLSGAAAHISARIDQFNCPVGATASCNVNGKPLPFSPNNRYNIRGNYRVPVGGGLTMDAGMDYNWQSQVIYDISQSPDAIQPAYGIVNATVSLSNTAKGWRIAVLGKNLANRSYSPLLATGGTIVVRFVPRDDRRYFGITARYDF